MLIIVWHVALLHGVATLCGVALWHRSMVPLCFVTPRHRFCTSLRGDRLRGIASSLRFVVLLVFSVVVNRRYTLNRIYRRLCLPVCTENNQRIYYSTYLSHLMFKSLIYLVHYLVHYFNIWPLWRSDYNFWQLWKYDCNSWKKGQITNIANKFFNQISNHPTLKITEVNSNINVWKLSTL